MALLGVRNLEDFKDFCSVVLPLGTVAILVVWIATGFLNF